jgi:hypothetical protein
MRPKIRILPDGVETGDKRMYWCGYWPEGYAVLGPVDSMSLKDAVTFYLKVLRG